MFAYIFKCVQKHSSHGKLHAQWLTFISSGSEIVERSWGGYISVSAIGGENGEQVDTLTKKCKMLPAPREDDSMYFR